ncbi:MAG: hypothetical protein AB7O38_27005, partial [Pirellulaceae bacterium]
VRGILHGFPHFPRTSVATMAAIRLLNPTSAYQGATETCGPTAFSIDLCRNRPREWVNTLIALATHGSARINTLEMKPDPDVRHRKLNETGGMAPVDWIVVASLRSTLCGLMSYRAASLFKGSLENFGIHPGALFDWLTASGFSTVCLFGQNSLSDALFNRFVKQIHGARTHLTGLLNGLDATPEALLRFLSPRLATESWSVFVCIEHRLSNALREGTAADGVNRQARLDLVQSARPPRPSNPTDLRETFTPQALGAFTQSTSHKVFGAAAKMQRARSQLTSDNTAGHVMVLHDIEIGGFYVSCTVSNYGELMYHHSLPVKEFLATVRSVVAATDLLR